MGRMRQLLLATFLFSLTTQVICHRSCQHGNEQAQIIHKVPLEPKHHLLKRALDQPIRIREFYDSTVNSLTQSFQDLIKQNVVPKVIEFLSMALQVRRTERPILLSRGCVGGSKFVVPDSPYLHCSRGCVAQSMCGTFVIPEDHLQRCCQNNTVSACNSTGSDGAGVADADFVLYVSADGTGKCMNAVSSGGELIAFATHCQQEAALDRPIAGSVNLCPDAVQGGDLEKVIATVKHELLHAMGFSSSLYPFFHDENQMPRTPRDDNGLPPLNSNGMFQPDPNTLRNVTISDWLVSSGPISYEVDMIVTPAVQREARSHFGCDTLEGAQLENQGSDATAGSHWEKRLFQNEAMTGIFTENPVFSRITLALLEDSGWYRVNYTMAGTLVWGRGLGCDFVNTSCRSWLLNQIANEETLEPFCNIPRGSTTGTRTDCTYDHLSVGICNLIQFDDNLPPQFQHFDMATLPDDISNTILNNAQRYGSNIQIADFCPFVQQLTFTSAGNVQRETECFNTSNQISESQNIAGEFYGPNSRCFLQGGPWMFTLGSSAITARDYGGGCYEYACTESGLRLRVQGQEFLCSCKGETLMIDVTNNNRRYQGPIICPACMDVCWDEPNVCPSPEPPACYNRITFTTVTNPTSPTGNPTTTATDDTGGYPKLHGQATLIATLVLTVLKMT